MQIFSKADIFLKNKRPKDYLYGIHLYYCNIRYGTLYCSNYLTVALSMPIPKLIVATITDTTPSIHSL